LRLEVLVALLALLMTFAIAAVEESLLATRNTTMKGALARVRLLMSFEREQCGKGLLALRTLKLRRVPASPTVSLKHRLASHRFAASRG
jgi:hypothetical protein